MIESQPKWAGITAFLQAEVSIPVETSGVIVIIATVVTAIAAVVGLMPFFQQWLREYVLARRFGGELYDKQTIRRATKYYIEPVCTDADPAVEAELRKLHIIQNNLFDAVDRFLDKESPNKHLLLLADSGMGKTSFVLNYYAKNRARIFKRRRLAVVPLGIPDADKHIDSIKRKNETILFLDAFDEDTLAIENHRERILHLMEQCRVYKRVVITCRSQFFLSDEEIVERTGIIRIGTTRMGERREYEFMKLYLSPFDDDQVKKYLNKRYRFDRRTRKKAKELVNKIKALSVRPMLLAYIPDLIKAEKPIEYSVDVYEEMVSAWVNRESGFWKDTGALLKFSEQLAEDLFREREKRRSEKINHAELMTIVDSWKGPLKERLKDINKWQLTGRSLLNRDAVGNYKFSHRSILEYLVAKQIVGQPEKFVEVKLTEQMQRFLLELFGLDERHYPTRNEWRTWELGKHVKPIRESNTSLGEFVRSRPEPAMVHVKEGLFYMGEAERKRLMQRVFVSDYSISLYPITNRQYQDFLKEKGYPAPRDWQGQSYPEGKSNHPVVYVSWGDAMVYCEWLSERTGRRYSLPTEAQWEKACRGTDGRIYPWGNNWSSNRLNSFESGIHTTTPVKKYSPDGDSPSDASGMVGNVWEWCRDWYEPLFPNRKDEEIKNPVGPQEGKSKVLRGGSFLSPQDSCRCAARLYNRPDDRDFNLGFRVVLLPSTLKSEHSEP